MSLTVASWSFVGLIVLAIILYLAISEYKKSKSRRNTLKELRAAYQATQRRRLAEVTQRIEEAEKSPKILHTTFQNDYARDDDGSFNCAEVILWSGDDELFNRYRLVQMRMAQEKKYLDSLAERSELLGKWRSDEPSIVALLHLIEGLEFKQEDVRLRLETDLGITLEAAKLQAQVYIESTYRELLPHARSDAETLKKLHELIRVSKRGIAKNAGIIPLEYPANWNDWVARFISIPVTTDFVGVVPYEKMPIGGFRDYAAAALHEQSLMKAKIALSYCNRRVQNTKYPYNDIDGGARARTEMGTLAEQLAVMIKRIMSELRTI